VRPGETLAQNPKPTPCAVEAMAREHAKLVHFTGHTVPSSDVAEEMSRAEARSFGIERSAPFLQATSAGGALFQTMLVKLLVEDIEDEAKESATPLPAAVFYSIYSALYSIGAVLEKLSGDDRRAFSADYALSAEFDPRAVAGRLPLLTTEA
jgi:hypothetical protein